MFSGVAQWLIGVGIVSVLVHLAVEEDKRGELRALSKIVAAASFVALAFVERAWQADATRWIAAALVAGAVGDTLLLSRANGPLFRAGVASFAMDHLLMCAAFISLGVAFNAALAFGLIASVFAAGVYVWLLPDVPRDLRGSVAFYSVVIAVMVSLSFGAYVFENERFDTPQRLASFVAALAFWLSDVLVARDRFKSPSWINRVISLPLYFAAQFVFATSVSAFVHVH